MYFTSKPSEVFTPRNRSVNASMYIERDVLERRLKEALNGHKHFIIHGESGNGKTWLWKRVFSATKTSFTTINLARAGALNSISGAIWEKLQRDVPRRETGTEQSGSAGVKPAGIGFSGETKLTIEHRESEPFFELLKANRGIKSKHSIIVFENFEQIASINSLVRELASYLILLDDDDYAEHNCRICIVGVPGNLKEFLTSIPFSETIASRLIEIDEVARMTPNEATELLLRGFGHLRLRFRDDETKQKSLRRILWVSDRNADQLHELGLSISEAARESQNTIDFSLVSEAINVWINSKHASSCAVIEKKMSPADTLHGRRNQVIFCIGLMESDDFGIVDIKKSIKRNFNSHANWVDNSFDEVFTTLVDGFNPLLKPDTQLGSYRIAKSVYRMAIRCLLQIDNDGGVFKVGRSH